MKASSAWSFFFLLVGAIAISAQTPTSSPATAKESVPTVTSCDHERALLLVKEQLEEVKLFEPKWQRVLILLKAAPLLWESKQSDAREIFQAAFDQAQQVVAERANQPKEAAKPVANAKTAPTYDLRLEVIHAIAKYDGQWARELNAKVVAEHKQQVAEAKAKPTNFGLYQELLRYATKILPTDQATALQMAKASLAGETESGLVTFLVALSKQDRTAATLFFLEALEIVSSSSVRDTLYLFTYAFAQDRPLGAEKLSWRLLDAQTLQANPSVQAAYLETLFKMAGRYMNPQSAIAPVKSGAYGLTDAAKLFLAFSDLEPLVASRFPAMHGRLLETKTALSGVLGEELVKVHGVVDDQKQVRFSNGTFAEFMQKAEAEKNPGRQDSYYFSAIVVGVNTEKLETLEGILVKIHKPSLRDDMSDWLYYYYGERYIKEARLGEAMKLAEKVRAADLHSFLSMKIAETALQKNLDRQIARESLDAAWRVVEKAEATIESAKAMLGIASLYQQFDQQTALTVLRAALKAINRLPVADVSSLAFRKAVKGDTFEAHVIYQMEGRGLNEVFRDFGKVDYETALATARELDDKALQADAIFSLSSYCLSQPPPKAAAPAKKSN